MNQARKNRKSIPFIIAIISFILTGQKTVLAQKIEVPREVSQAHPRIYAGINAGIDLKGKLERSPWAGKIMNDIEDELEPYMRHFDTDSTWLVSRLQMYWNSHHTDIYIKGTNFLRAEGHAVLPTVRFAGTRDWATKYKVPELADLKPYDDKADGTVYMVDQENKGAWVLPQQTGLVIEEINEKILDLAQNAAFMYWFTGKQQYARFAAIVLKTYIKGLYYRRLPVNTIDSQESYLTGLTSFEVIHEEVIVPTTVCYDFLYDYLKKSAPGFNEQFAAPVFKKWADNIIEKGVPDNNWNIFEMRYISYLALALDNDKAYADGKGISYYLDVVYNRNFPRQMSFTKSLEGFDKKTGTWHEAPRYNLHVCNDMVGIVALTDRVMADKLRPVLPILKKAVFTTAQYLFPNKRTTAYGDSNYDLLPADNLEQLISLSRKYGDAEDEQKLTRLLKYSQDAPLKRGREKSLFDLFFLVESLKDTPPATLADFSSPTFYAPNQSWIVQRNGFDRTKGLMISSNASLGNHSHANGINMELYGKGYPLGLDFSYGESYWHPAYRGFYAQFAAHNTVVVDGKSAYGSMLTAFPFTLRGCYPATGKSTGYFKPVTFSSIFFTEPSTDAKQLRLLSIVRTTDTSGYYVDIFRSAKNKGGDIKHEYLYHNLGQQVAIYNRGNTKIPLSLTTELSSSKGDIPGYDYFKDKSTANFDGDFRTRFELKIKGDPIIEMNVWMKGDSARQLFLARSPKSYALKTGATPQDIAEAEVPTLIVRQQGEAWTHPFAAILEPSFAGGQTVVSMSSFKPAVKNDEFVGLVVKNTNHCTQLIFSDVDGLKPNQYLGFSFTGTYAVASETGTDLQYLFLGDGKAFTKKGYGLLSIDKAISAALVFGKTGLRLYADQPLKIVLPFTGKGKSVYLEVTGNGKTKKFPGRILNRGEHKQAEFTLPGFPGQELAIRLKSY